MKKYLALAVAALLMTPHVKADTLLFSDDFSSGLANTNFAFSGATNIVFASGSLVATGRCMIQTVQSYSDDIRVDVDVEKSGNLNIPWYDVYFTLGSIVPRAILRFDTEKMDSIAIGNVGATNNNWLSLPADSPNQGRLSLLYRKGYMTLVYTCANGQMISSEAVNVGIRNPVRISINAIGSADSPRMLRNFRVYAIEPEAAVLSVDRAVNVWFDTSLGSAYTIQKSTNTTVWEDVGAPVAGTGNRVDNYFPVTMPATYYRVLAH